MVAKCLFLFVDALSARYVDDSSLMPSVRKAITAVGYSEFTPLLGYSQAIKASIFTGQPPVVHNVYGKYRFNFDNPRFGWVSNVPFLELIDRFPIVRYPFNLLISKLLDMPVSNMPLGAMPFLTPFELEDHYNHLFIGGAETVFNKLCSDSRKYSFFGYPAVSTDSEAIRFLMRSSFKDDFTILYLSGLDHHGHRTPFRSPSFKDTLRIYDGYISDVLKFASRNDVQVILFSDHGMSEVRRTVDIVSLLRKQGLVLGKDYAAIIDSTMFRGVDLKENNHLRAALNRIRGGHVLTTDEMRVYEIDFHGREHGQIFYLLDEGGVFVPDFFSVVGQTPAGMHGYAPSLESQKGIFLSTRDVYRGSRYVTFRDVYQEICASLSL